MTTRPEQNGPLQGMPRASGEALTSAYDYVAPFVGGIGTQTYGTAGSYELTVPDGVFVVRAKAWGAAGAGSGARKGGAGAFVQADFAVRPGDKVISLVGAGGVNNYGARGGDLVALIRRDATGNNTLLLVAGSGGSYDPSAGEDGRPGVAASSGSQDGSQLSGGTGTSGTGGTGGNGSFLRGGRGGLLTGSGIDGGDGGDGYYGGGGGAGSNTNSTGAADPGGGGSSYVHPTQTVRTTLTAGSGFTPPNTGDADYGGSAGEGVGGSGNAGRIVLRY